jgi:hypothetical protein
MKRLLMVVPLATFVASALVALPASADDRRCRGTISPVSIDDNVIVPQGARCVLNGTRVGGNVEVKRGGRLVARGVKVDGNIQTQAHGSVLVKPRRVDDRVVRSRIEGDIQIESGGRGIVRRATIGGNLQTKQNGGRQVAIRNVIDGDLQAFSNRGGVRIRGNVIDGNLQCKSNSPSPVGGDNRVHGTRKGSVGTSDRARETCALAALTGAQWLVDRRDPAIARPMGADDPGRAPRERVILSLLLRSTIRRSDGICAGHGAFDLPVRRR